MGRTVLLKKSRQSVFKIRMKLPLPNVQIERKNKTNELLNKILMQMLNF